MQCPTQVAFDGPGRPQEEGPQRALRRLLLGSHGLVEKALEPKPCLGTSPHEPGLGSCKA